MGKIPKTPCVGEEGIIYFPIALALCEKETDWNCNVSLATTAKKIAKKYQDLPKQNSELSGLLDFMERYLDRLRHELIKRGLPVAYIDSILRTE